MIRADLRDFAFIYGRHRARGASALAAVRAGYRAILHPISHYRRWM
jgi:hypothetical protein